MSGPIRQGSYVYAGASDEVERLRLRGLDAWAAPLTLRQFDRVGISSGWRCLDVGAGDGTVARELARRVGRSGRVLATDISLRFLDDLPAAIEVRRHDISADALPCEAFDLVHCRLVLIHLARPDEALSRMVDAVKPGGSLVLEDADWGLCTIGGHPEGDWATRYLHEISRLHTRAGLRYPYFGRTLPGRVAALGLQEVAGEAYSPICLEGDPILAMHRETLRQLRAPSLTLGASEEDFDHFLAVLESPSVTILGATLVGMRGRKPGPAHP
jgi:SAM-dependent methyltransferase